ncbi:hypothetical protein [Actinoplanes subtropicus]|uniref:hypothetical protein n=1 Tax=Actinoplanes subtropicus TaxID=543632 RepID=UPI0012F8FA5E|nr:hypothetical protein [Actinoplanes subtropicus]
MPPTQLPKNGLTKSQNLNDSRPPTAASSGIDLLDWRGRLALFFLGTVLGGLVINILSNDYRWRAAVAAAGAGSIFAIAAWIHSRGSGAPVFRWFVRGLLFLAFATIVLSLILASIAPWLIGVLIVLLTAAIVITGDHATLTVQIRAVAAVGIGGSLMASGVSSDGGRLEGFVILWGLSFLLVGVVKLAGKLALELAIWTMLGIEATAFGVLLLLEHSYFWGVGLIGAGTTLIAGCAAVLWIVVGMSRQQFPTDRQMSTFESVARVAGLVFSLTICAEGIAFLHVNLLIGVVTIAGGLALAVLAFAGSWDRDGLFWTVCTAASLVPTTNGIISVVDVGPNLGGFALLIAGLSGMAYGIAEVAKTSVGSRLRRWWADATTDPTRELDDRDNGQ